MVKKRSPNSPDARATIVQWMRDVLRARDWSAEQWARLADTAPTNITRFLAGAPHLPSARTLAKLAKAAGSGPSIGLVDHVGLTRVRLLPPRALRIIRVAISKGSPVNKAIAEVGTVDTVAASAPVSAAAFAALIELPTLTGEGFMPGDLVVVEPASVLPLKPGAAVFAVNGDRGAVYRYHPPMLVPNILGAPNTPVPIESVVILGTVRQLIRSIR